MSTYRGKRFRPEPEEPSSPEIAPKQEPQDKHPRARRARQTPEATPEVSQVKASPASSSAPEEPFQVKAQPAVSSAPKEAPQVKAQPAPTATPKKEVKTPPVSESTSKMPAKSAPSPKESQRRARANRTKGEKPTSTAPQRRVRDAAPDAFKHHDAAIEDGTGKRHSKRRTFLIAIPIIIVVVAAFVAAGFALSSMLAEGEPDVEAGLPVTVVIPEGSSTNAIATILKESQVIGSSQDFIDEVQKRGVEQLLMPGTYELETRMDFGTLIDTLVAGPTDNGGGNLTIPEGLTVEQTAEVVEASLDISKDDFIKHAYAASDYVGDYPFLEGVYNNSLEGFLYPKTYNVPEGASADEVIRLLLDQFAKETSELNLSYAEASNMNLFNIVTIASLIEKETASSEERPLVSSVIYNRLRNGMMLQIDATVVYALGADYDGGLLSYENLEIDSPYNTYKTTELPAGPICSPSIESLEAAAHPAETDYLYYVVTSEDGSHTFCVTEEEFYAAKEEHDILFGIE